MSVISGIYQGSATKSAASTQAGATLEAGKISADATKEAIAETKRQFDLGRIDTAEYNRQVREDFEKYRAEDLALAAPWIEAGTEALGDIGGIIDMIEAGPGEFERDPGQEFIRSEGEKALNISAAAKGNLLSTNQVKNLIRFGQDRASTDYDSFLKRFRDKMSFQLNPQLSLARLGQINPNVATGDRGPTAALPPSTNQIPNLLLQQGQQRGNTLINAARFTAQGQTGAADAYSNISSNAVNAYLAYKYYTA